MLQNLIMYLVRARSCVMGFAKHCPELIYWKGLIIWFGIVRLEYKGVPLLSIFDTLEFRRIMCRGWIEWYCLPNGIGNIPWLHYFLAILFNMFYGWAAPIALNFTSMSQHFFIDVLAFSLDTYSCQLFFLLARMTCLAFTLFIQYSCKFVFVGYLLKTLRDLFRSNIASLHSSEKHGFCGFLGLGFDFGIVSLAISQSL